MEKENSDIALIEEDFSITNERVTTKELEKKSIENENKELLKKINKRHELIYDQTEKQISELKQKIEQIKKEKETYLVLIKDSDSKRQIAVKKTFKSVSKNLNDIFQTLLTGTEARISYVDESSLNHGAQLNVAFNGTWKNSLSELSGGQKSLLALSFILAMMKESPAPVYILDEIDSALDIENTQNIGLMIKTHFKGSQFIIISLKEQMNYNASTIYRVSNTDGKSAVAKFTNNKVYK